MRAALTIALLLLLAAYGPAQAPFPPTDCRAVVVPSAKGKILIALPDGTLAAVDPPDGVVIDTSGSAPVLRARVRALGIMFAYPPPSVAPRTFQLTAAPETIAVYYKRERMKFGQDFTLDGSRILFNASFGEMDANQVQVDFTWPAK